MDWKTPTDAVAKGQFFFLMKRKSVFAMKQPNGTNIQFLFQDCGRMTTAARLVGNVEDEEQLKLLSTAEGFRRLVKGIGISAETDPMSKVKIDKTTFAFQFYGKTDPYKSGTTFTKEVSLTGAEEYIDLSEVDWSKDDVGPGQIRFEFDKSDVLALVTVKFYLQEGFEAPEAQPDREIDFESDDYAAMIKRSVVNYGNLSRIQKAINDAKAGKDVTLAFIGGSITQGAGAVPINEKCYAYLTYLNFCRLCGRKPGENIHYVKAGVGGTPSELGMLRYKREVTDNGRVKPDIVIVEFAVNDGDDETRGICYESLCKMILEGENHPAVILPFSVFADDGNFQERLIPVGFGYEIPMVSIKNAVIPEFHLSDRNASVINRTEFFYDQYHPTNTGHIVMADCISEIFRKAEEVAVTEIPVNTEVTPAIGDDFHSIVLFDRVDQFDGASITCGSFTEDDTELQAVERNLDLSLTPEFTNNWHHVSGTEEFVLNIRCKKLVMIFKDSSSPEFGIAEIYDNGKKVLETDPRKVGWTHCHAIVIFNNNVTEDHIVTISMKKGDENKKYTILGFGAVK